MIGVTQQNSKQDNLSTLKAVLEEEQDINTNHVNDAIPFDKCIEADKQADEEAKKRKCYSQLGTAKTTKEQCEREIKEWLGTSTIIKTIFKTTYSSVIAFAISVGTTIWFWNPNYFNSEELTPQGIGLTILIGASLAIGICVLVSIADTELNSITTKMSEKDYMIKEDIVDCPIAVKNKFLSYVKIDELYGKVNAEKNRFEWLNNDGECCHYWTFEKSKDRNDIEYQMKYLADQLEAGKVYKLADIITDKVKKKVSQ